MCKLLTISGSLHTPARLLRMMLTTVLFVAFFVAWLVPAPVLAAESQITNLLSPLPGVSLVEGQQVSFLHHQPVATFRVYAFRNDTLIPIPFQIDERDQRDRWVLDQGARPNPDNPAGEFDGNDAIVLMNRDLGARGDSAKLPGGATAWGEIRVGNEANPLGFAYVGSFNSPPPLPSNEHPYARYDPETDRVYAERYALEFRAPLPTHVAFVDQLNEFGTNTVAGVHATGKVRFLGGLLTLHRTDADLQMELLGYRNGPVRVIRRARYWIPLPFGFHTAGRVDLLFYRDFVEGTALVKLKIPPRLVLADGELQAYFDFLHLSDARLLLDGSPPSDPVNGHLTAEKKTLAGQPARWAALLLPDGRVVLLIVRMEGSLQKLEQQLYFDDSAGAGHEFGGQPLFGFQFARVNRLETGTHRLSVFAAVLDGVSVEDIPKAAQVFLSPPEVSVSLVGNL
jgi:hypothetical protein